MSHTYMFYSELYYYYARIEETTARDDMRILYGFGGFLYAFRLRIEDYGWR